MTFDSSINLSRLTPQASVNEIGMHAKQETAQSSPTPLPSSAGSDTPIAKMNEGASLLRGALKGSRLSVDVNQAITGKLIPLSLTLNALTMTKSETEGSSLFDNNIATTLDAMSQLQDAWLIESSSTLAEMTPSTSL